MSSDREYTVLDYSWTQGVARAPTSPLDLAARPATEAPVGQGKLQVVLIADVGRLRPRT